MTSKFSQFVGQTKSIGVARANKYSVRIQPPLGLMQFSDLDMLELYCIDTTLPGIKLETTAINDLMGEPRTVPYNRAFEEFDITFIMDDLYIARQLFEKWINSVYDPVTKTVSYYNDYIGSVTINGLGNDTNNHLTVVLNEAYPSAIKGITYSAESDEYVKLTVSFIYKNYILGASLYA